MNYFAHAFLSPADDQVMVGNMIGDFVRSLDGLAPGIRRGVVLHRQIDSYTNTHAAFRRSSRRLFPVMGHYARVVVDVFYDHLLTRHCEDYTDAGTLTDFVQAIDLRYQAQRHFLPEDLPVRWRSVDWLASYARTEGVVQSLRRLSRRSRRGVDLTAAMPLLARHRQGLKAVRHLDRFDCHRR